MDEPEREEPDTVAEDIGDLELEADAGVKGGGSGFPTPRHHPAQ
jgi:hypothetical protein